MLKVWSTLINASHAKLHQSCQCVMWCAEDTSNLCNFLVEVSHAEVYACSVCIGATA